MLPTMPSSRVKPLAGWSVVAVFVLIGVALIATVWSTRSSVVNASEAVLRGQALAIQQAVRADLADLEAMPSSADLDAILKGHAGEGLRYIAMVEGGVAIAAAGSSVGGPIASRRSRSATASRRASRSAR